MLDLTRRSSAAALGLLLGLAVSVAACSKTTTQNTVASTQAPGTTEAKSGTTEHKRSATTNKTEPKTDDTGGDQTTTSRHSTSSTSDGGMGPMSIPTITVTPAAGNEEFCNTMASAYNDLVTSLSTTPANDLDATDKVIIEASRQLYSRLVEAAPPDIKPAFEKLNNAVQNATSTRELTLAGSDPEMKAASDEVEKYMLDNCGINPKLGS